MIKIRVITPFPNIPDSPIRVIEDLYPYQTDGIKLSLSHNSMGSISGRSHTDHEFSKPGMAQKAVEAEQEGIDAIVIESMGDTALEACREVVDIPVVGMSDVSMRVACMLSRKFGMITAGTWQAHALEKLAKLYNVTDQYAGFASLDLQPFFTDITTAEELESKLLSAALFLLEEKDADTILFGGSYFMGMDKKIRALLLKQGYNIPIIDPLPLAIYFARTFVEAGLSQSKRIYTHPPFATKVYGYSGIEVIPGVKNAEGK